MSGTFTLATYTSQGWAIDTGSLSNPLPSLVPLNLTYGLVTPANPIVSATTTYQFLLMVYTDIPTGSYFILTLPTSPSDLDVTSASPACTSVFTTVTLTCTYTSGTRQLKVSGMFNPGNNDGTYGIDVDHFFNGANALTTSSFSMELYSSGGYLIATEYSGLTT